jgi:MerR family transcriptional regulator, light-induced transcriptional regulator
MLTTMRTGGEGAMKDVLSTRQVAQLLGVGEATVKRWADAGEIECFRTPGGHRKFRLRDVTAFVTRRGYHVAGPLPSQLPSGAEDEDPSEVFEATALRGDTQALVGQLASLRLRGYELPRAFDEVVAPALVRVGEQWETCKLSVAEEHVASQAVIDAIARAQPLAEPPGEAVRPRGTAIVAAAAGELHDIPVRMAACLLRASAWEVLAPLAQTPARDLAEMIVRARAGVVVLGSVVASDPGALAEQVRMAAAAAKQSGGRLLVGGPGMGKIDLPPGAHLLANMQELASEAATGGRRRA